MLSQTMQWFRKSTQPSFALTLALGVLVTLAARSVHAEEGFQPLFDGKSLAGWQGDAALWRVENGEIVGTTDGHKITKNTFLASEKQYSNFVLRLKFKLRNGNSGVQFRSKQFPEHVVRGYQADIADQRYMGILYEEGGRGILADVKNPEEVAQHWQRDGWNEYVLTADGGHIRQELNGFTTVDYQETSAEGAKTGILALQLHVGPDMEVRFKDVQLKPLP